MIIIPVQDKSGEDLQTTIAKIDNIEHRTTRNDNEYVQVTTRDGDRYSCWEDFWQQKLLDNKDEYEGAYWEITWVDNDGYRNIRPITEADDDAVEAAEADADPLVEVSREERIRKSTALHVASRISEPGTPPEQVVAKAKEVDAAFVDWLAGTDAS